MLATARVEKNRGKEENENIHNSITVTAVARWTSKSRYTGRTNFQGQYEYGS